MSYEPQNRISRYWSDPRASDRALSEKSRFRPCPELHIEFTPRRVSCEGCYDNIQTPRGKDNSRPDFTAARVGKCDWRQAEIATRWAKLRRFGWLGKVHMFVLRFLVVSSSELALFDSLNSSDRGWLEAHINRGIVGSGCVEQLL
jgi:hypothetical protein